MYHLELFPPSYTKHAIFLCFASQKLSHKIGTSHKLSVLGFAYIITILSNYFWFYLHNEKGNNFISITVNIKLSLSLLHREGTLFVLI